MQRMIRQLAVVYIRNINSC